jgi:hypothetical protein
MARLLAVVALLVFAAPASAKLYFTQIGGRAVRWDERVSTTIANCPGNPSCRSAVQNARVWIRRAGSRQLRFVARVDHNGTLRFRVPHVRPGRYVLVAEGRAVSQSFRIRAG